MHYYTHVVILAARSGHARRNLVTRLEVSVPHRCRHVGLGVLLASIFLMVLAGQVSAESPAPSPDGVADMRTGRSAGITGDPILAAVAVVALGMAAAAGTFVVLRASARIRR